MNKLKTIKRYDITINKWIIGYWVDSTFVITGFSET